MSTDEQATHKTVTNKTVNVTFSGSQGEAGQWGFSENPVELDRGQSTVTYAIQGWNFRAISIARADGPSEEGYVDARAGDEGHAFTSSDGLFTITLASMTDDRIVLDFDVSISLSSKTVLAMVLTVGKDSMRRSSRDPQIVLKPDGP